MTPSLDEATTALRQRRVRRTAGLLVGGAVVATTALAIPAVALVTSDGEVPAAADTAVLSAVEAAPVATALPTTTTTTAPAPTPEEQFAADWASWSPEQQFQFRLWVSTDEERTQILRYLFPAPPPAPAPRPAPAPKPAPRPQSAPSPAGNAAPGGYLACVRQHESGGRYNINTGNGYYGAYQFLPSTWNATAQRAGRPDLVGVLPSNASPADQDAMAQALYASNGRQPWAGNGC
jgi:hypothetical protein